MKYILTLSEQQPGNHVLDVHKKIEMNRAFGQLQDMFNTRTPGLVSIGRAGFTELARGFTPLHDAAREGEAEAVKALLEAKASVAAKDDYGRGAFDWTGDVDFGAPGVVRTPLKTVDALIWGYQFQKNGVECSLEGLSFHTLPFHSHSFMNCFDLHIMQS